jgi:anthranilate/para-aminobenzoate synthase component I
LLESTTAAGPLARHSVLLREPRAVLLADRAGARVFRSRGRVEPAGSPIAALRGLLAELPAGRWPDEGGVVGALAYDLARPARPGEPGPLLVALAAERLEVLEEAGAAQTRPIAGTWPRSAACASTS